MRKALVAFDGETLVERSARAFADVGGISDRVVVLHADDLAACEDSGLSARLRRLGVRAIVAGGATRQDSALSGVRATDPTVRDVLVHDAARAFVKRERIADLLRALDSCDAALLATPMAATVKRVDSKRHVVETVPRSDLWQATTPQGGRRALMMKLLEDAASSGRAVTDEASLFEAAGIAPRVVEDDGTNLKITWPADLALARGLVPPPLPRVGHGYDIHRLVEGRKLVLGGVEIPSPLGLLGHSDADVLLHAVIEAMLGAAGLPDIGEHFPDTDPRFKGIASTELLRVTIDELRARGLRVAQVDCSIVAERPKLMPHKARIRESLQTLLALPADRVAVKARTNEGLDAIGRGEAMATHCVAVVVPVA